MMSLIGILLIMCLSASSGYADEPSYYFKKDESTGVQVCMNPDTVARYPAAAPFFPHDYKDASRSVLVWFTKVAGYVESDPQKDKIPSFLPMNFIVTPEGDMLDFKLLDEEHSQDSAYSTYRSQFIKATSDRRLEKWTPAKAGGKNVYTRITGYLRICSRR